jgi:hypothetical protein
VRGISTAGAALAVALTFLACGSFGEGDAPAGPQANDATGGDAGASSDGSSGGETGTAADGGGIGPKSCAARAGSVLLCEDFEGADPLGEWVINANGGGQVSVIADATRGGNVFLAKLTPFDRSGHAQIGTAPSWAGPLHVRFYAFIEQPLLNSDYQILVVLRNVEIGIEEGTLLLNQYPAPPIYEAASIPFPVKKWTCVEWSIESTRSTIRMDGKVVLDRADTILATTDMFYLGAAYNAGNGTDRSFLFDDVVVSTMPVGCD